MHKIGWILVVIILIGVVILTIYWYLGGFEPVVYKLEKGDKVTLAGKWYRSKYRSDSVEELFNEMKYYVTSGIIPGQVAILEPMEMSQQTDSVNFFIAVSTESNLQIPDSLEVIVIPSSGRLAARLNMHPLVMPSPKLVREKLQSLADTVAAQLQPFIIEEYGQNNEVKVLIPLK